MAHYLFIIAFLLSIKQTYSAQAQTRQHGTLPATLLPYPNTRGDSQWISPVLIGNQKLNLMLDTGSNYLFVFGANLPHEIADGHNTYNASKSPTSQHVANSSASLTYGGANQVSGVIVKDTIQLGGVKISDQDIIVVDKVNREFGENKACDGFLGLGLGNDPLISGRDVHPQPAKSPAQRLTDTLERPLFSADINHNGSSYDFGFVDRAKYSGDLTYFAVNASKHRWQLADSVHVNSKRVNIEEFGPVTLDSGSALIYMPEDIVHDYYAKVPTAKQLDKNGDYTYECSVNKTLPSLNITIGKSYSAIVPSSMMSFSPNMSDAKRCIGTVQPASVPLLGGPFFKSQFAVFDIGNTTVGLAQKSKRA